MVTLPNIIKLFRKYQLNLNDSNMSFYDWIKESNLDLDLDLDLDLLKKINSMFEIEISDLKNDLKNDTKNIKIYNGPIQKSALREILKEDGFLFID